MIRIRHLHDAALPVSQDRIAQAAAILRENFPELSGRADRISCLLANPFDSMYRTTLLVAETSLGKVLGFSLILHFKEINSSFLDYIAVGKNIKGGGIGGALYEATREYCQANNSSGIYMEVDPDDPALTDNVAELELRRKRMRFYENYGVRPIINNDYHLPAGQPPSCAYLLYDGLGRDELPSRAEVRSAVRWILQRRFKDVVNQAYIEEVIESFIDDPICLRPRKYSKKPEPAKTVATGILEKPFVMVSDQNHEIHHVRSKGYFEKPARVATITEAMKLTGLFTAIGPRRFKEDAILAVHDKHFVEFLKVVCTKLSAKRSVYPDTFPIRRRNRRPKNLPTQAGYYCIDSCTPLDQNAYKAARGSVNVALTAAEEILAGCKVAYAVCRPPGHHAESKVYGGFCYFNNAAIAANYLSKVGKVAILDIDFHHGNGTQDIFYNRNDVLTVSIHGDPDGAFPYFSGFNDELGQGDGLGFNFNYPLAAGTDDRLYLKTFDKALGNLKKFKPEFIIVSLGMDIMKNDPTGTFNISVKALKTIGARLTGLNRPVLVIQEGGYSLRNLKTGTAALFNGMAEASISQA
ncbi:MAG: histone deacetylase family protein [Phycisphaerae bacterium]|nr:histone deacetylase family protein [Phycisphaerae bacterium]